MHISWDTGFNCLSCLAVKTKTGWSHMLNKNIMYTYIYISVTQLVLFKDGSANKCK